MGDLRRRALFSTGSDSPYGVYAYYSDGSLRTYKYADTDAIGVAILSEKCQIVIDKNITFTGPLAAPSKSLSGATMVTSDTSLAVTDFNGERNTTNIIAALDGYTNTTYNITGAPGLEACRAAFGGRGYIGALGECMEVYVSREEVDRMITKIGGTILSNYGIMSTTANNATSSMHTINFVNEVIQQPSRRNNRKHRAFLKIYVPILIDLGLPSGTLWAAGNICKDSNGNYYMGNPTDYGCYFSWGNIIGYNKGEGYNFSDANYQTTPGYSVDADIPSNDATHDMALATLGSPWHLPTKEDFQELYDNTDNEWTTINGVNGYKFMKKTDHSIYVFFPASGFYDGTSLSTRGSNGYCWSSSWDSSTKAYYLGFNSSTVYPQRIYRNRRVGFTVRAVKSK